MVLEVRGLTRMIEPTAFPKHTNNNNIKSESFFDDEEEDELPLLLKENETSKLIFSNISFSLPKGKIVAIQGKTGCGKTQLLRAVAQLDPLNGGDVLLYGKTPEEIGYCLWRTRVSYCNINQINFIDSSSTPTPNEYFKYIMQFEAHIERRTRFADPVLIAQRWYINSDLFNTNWRELTASEHARIMLGTTTDFLFFYLAIAIACRPDVLLLDEPTITFDHNLTLLVEKTIRALGLTVVWATTDVFQAERVADTVLIFNHITQVEETSEETDELLESTNISPITKPVTHRLSSFLQPSETHQPTIAQKNTPQRLPSVMEEVIPPTETLPPTALGKLAATVHAIAVAADIIADTAQYEAPAIVKDKLDLMFEANDIYGSDVLNNGKVTFNEHDFKENIKEEKDDDYKLDIL